MAPAKEPALHYKTVIHADVPQGRTGKHKAIVTAILQDLKRLDDGSAIKVPLAQLAQSKEKVRSALNRASRKAGLRLQTASDGGFLYVWNDRR